MDTVAFTAAAVLDITAPRFLRIASFQVSANDLAAATDYRLQDMGEPVELNAWNKSERAAHPEGERELYANWQQSQ